MTLVKKWNFSLCFLLSKIGHEIMFAHHPVRKQAYLDWKIRILPGRPMEIFLKGLTHDFCQKLEFFPLLAFKQNRPWNNVSDHPVRKQAYLVWKIRILPSRPMTIFSKVLTHDFGQKLGFFSFLPFKQNRPWNNVCSPSG